MTVVTEQLDLPGPPNSTPTLPGAARSLVGITLVGTAGQQVIGYGPGSTIVGERDVYPSNDGTWSLDLVPNALINPAGTAYRIEYSPLLAKQDVFIGVPVTGGPFLVEDLLVNQPGAAASAALLVAEQQRGIEHDWNVGGWAPFTKLIMSADGAQQFVETAANGRGTVAGTLGTNGNHRTVYRWNGTEWADSELTSLLNAPVGWTDGGAQQWHLHRIREVTPGVFEAIAIWTAVIGSDYRALNTRGVRWDGVTLFQSDGDAVATLDLNYIDRAMRVRAASRFPFAGQIQSYKILELDYLRDLTTSDRVDVVEMGDASFNESGLLISGLDQAVGNINLSDPGAGPNVSEASVFSGRVLPDSNTNQKRWTPYWLSTRVRGGSASSLVIEIKRWRPEDREPDWGDSRDGRVMRRTVLSNAGVPALALGPGAVGIGAAHLLDTSSVSWGSLRARRL